MLQHCTQKAPSGLQFPPCGVDDLPHVLRPSSEGGVLHHKGQVEVVSSLELDFRPVFRDLRWGVYVILEAPNDYAAAQNLPVKEVRLWETVNSYATYKGSK